MASNQRGRGNGHTVTVAASRLGQAVCHQQDRVIARVDRSSGLCPMDYAPVRVPINAAGLPVSETTPVDASEGTPVDASESEADRDATDGRAPDDARPRDRRARVPRAAVVDRAVAVDHASERP